MVRTTLGAEVETTVSVSGSEGVRFLNANRTGTVPAGESEFITVRPPAGKVFELLTARLDVAGISGQGSQSHQLALASESVGINALVGVSSGDTAIQYGSSFFRSANQQARPDTTAAQTQAVRGLRADASNGYELKYKNFTGGDQTKTRVYGLWLREIQVSS